MHSSCARDAAAADAALPAADLDTLAELWQSGFMS